MEKVAKIAIVGAGVRGVGCFAELIQKRNDCVIAALCDTNSFRLKCAADKLKVEKTYTNLNKMLNKEQLDGLIITTPDAEHEKCAVDALEHGVNILLDKPLATSRQGGLNIIEAARKSGKVAMMGFNLRHAPILKKLKEIVDEGVLGRIILMENREFYDGGRTYMARWNGKKSYSGGLWNHKGSHDFDIFNWLLNFPAPKKVSAFSGMSVFRPDQFPFETVDGIKPGPSCSECYYGKHNICKDVFIPGNSEMWGPEAIKEDGYRKDSCMYMSDLSVHDNGIAMVEYENGVRASHLECFVCGMSDRFYTISGDRGTAQLRLSGNTIEVIKRWSCEKITYEIPISESDLHGGADPILLTSFVETILGKRENKSTLEQGLISTTIAEAAEISREENRTVLL